VEDTENEPIGRGTIIKIHLKEEALEYLEEDKLKELVGKYSEFINFPIYLLSEKEVEVPIEEEDTTEEADSACPSSLQLVLGVTAYHPCFEACLHVEAGRR
jgi:heat shock protein 90kDa beta